jgi:hypothetical protein
VYAKLAKPAEGSPGMIIEFQFTEGQPFTGWTLSNVIGFKHRHSLCPTWNLCRKMLRCIRSTIDLSS